MLLALLQDVRPTIFTPGSIRSLALRSLRLVLTTPVTRVLVTVFGRLIPAQQTASPFFPLLIQRLHPGQTGLATTIELVFGASSLTGALLSTLAGLLGDRFGFRGALVDAALAGAASLAAMAGSTW